MNNLISDQILSIALDKKKKALKVTVIGSNPTPTPVSTNPLSIVPINDNDNSELLVQLKAILAALKTAAPAPEGNFLASVIDRGERKLLAIEYKYDRSIAEVQFV